MGSEVEGYVCTVQLDVGDAFGRDLHVWVRTEPALQQRDGLTDVRDHIFAAGLKAGHVDVDVLVSPSAAAFLHSAPVLERGGDKGVWRNHCQGIVPVAYLDRVEGDFFDIAVGTSVGHLDPVADLDHIVLG